MQTFICCTCITLSLLTIGNLCAETTTVGVIHLRGQIVEPPCDIQPSVRQVHVSCYRNGQDNVQSIALNALAEGRTINNAVSTVSLQWINRQKNLAILNIEYK